MSLKTIIGAVVAVCFVIAISMCVGYNDNGERTVIQTASGSTSVKFTPGPYFQWFGSTTSYPNVLTFDFDAKEDDVDHDTTAQMVGGIPVRYQDGGTGHIVGIARFSLPNSEEEMLALHRDFRSPQAVLSKLLQKTTEERVNLTAGLMSSEEAYNTKRGTFTEWSRDQVQNGKYKTTLQRMEAKDEALGSDTPVYKDFPVIQMGKDGQPLYTPDNDLRHYAVTVPSFQIVDWLFEQKTLDQIAAKRKATMAIITAKADAERAKQDTITAEQEGIAKVTVAKYEKEVEKQRAVVDAQKDKEVAVTAALRDKEVAETQAKQTVAVAEQEKLRQEQNKLANAEYKQAETLRGEGDAAYKRQVMEADGALTQKLKTYTEVVTSLGKSFGQQKLVPEVLMGGTGTAAGGAVQAADFMSILMAKTAKDLALDMNIGKPQQISKGEFLGNR